MIISAFFLYSVALGAAEGRDDKQFSVFNVIRYQISIQRNILLTAFFEDFPTTSARAPAVSTEPATRPRSAPASGDHPRVPVLQASESVVSSTSHVVELPALIIPTPPFLPTTPPLTRTPAYTHIVKPMIMSAS